MESEGGLEKLAQIAMGYGRLEDQLPALKFLTEQGYGKATQAMASDPEDAGTGVSIVITRTQPRAQTD
jgi:hypothetical protein